MNKKDRLKSSLDDVGTAPLMNAPMPTNPPGLDQAYGSQPPAVTSRPMPFSLNQPMENQAVAQGGQIEMNPLLAAIAGKMGLLGMIRNRTNTAMIDPDAY